MSNHLPPISNSNAFSVARKPGHGVADSLGKRGSKQATAADFSQVAQMALEKKRRTMKYVAKTNKENLLKDKALYRTEREMNLSHFRNIMTVFQEHGKTMTMESFQSLFANVLGENLTHEQMGLLFMKIDANTDNAVDWDEFSTFMLLRSERQSKMQEENSTQLFETPNPMNPTPKIVAPHHESIVSMIFLEQQRKFVTVSREGTVCFWSDQFRLRRCFLNVGLKPLQFDGREVMKHIGINKNNSLIDKETPWIHDILFMKPLNKFAMASDDHEITFYTIATMQGKIRFDLKDTVALCLDFWYDAENLDSETCTLLFGTDSGHVYTTTIVNSAFNKNENSKNKLTTITMDSFGRGETKGMGSFTKRKAHDNWVGKVKYYHDLHSVISCSIDPIESLSMAVQDGKNSWNYYSASVNHGVNTFVYCKFPVALITGGTDHQLRVWNPHRLKNPMASFKGHSASIIDLVLNEAAGQVISLSVDNNIKIWDIRKQFCVQTLFDRVETADDMLNCIYFNKWTNGKLLALARNIASYKLKGKDSDSVRKASVSTIGANVRTHDFPLRAAIYNPTFKQVITACDGGVVNVWDVITGAHIFKFSETHGKSELTAVTFDKGFRKLITGGRDGTIYIWNFHNGQKIRELVKSDRAEVTDIMQIEMHDTRYVIAVGWNRKITVFLDQDGEREYPHFQYPTGKETPAWHEDDIMCVAFAPPNLLVTASFDGGIVLSNVQSGHLLKRLKLPELESKLPINQSVEKAIFLTNRLDSKDAATLITAGADGIIRWWHTSDADLMWEMNGVPDRPGESIYAMCTTKNQEILITGDTAGWVIVYDITETCIDGRDRITPPTILKQFQAHAKSILSMDISETYFVTASTDGTSRMFTSHGSFIGTFGQEQLWDFNDPITFPHPPDIIEPPQEPTAIQKLKRVSSGILQTIKRTNSSGDLIDTEKIIKTTAKQLSRTASQFLSAKSLEVDEYSEGTGGSELHFPEKILSLAHYADIIGVPGKSSSYSINHSKVPSAKLTRNETPRKLSTYMTSDVLPKPETSIHMRSISTKEFVQPMEEPLDSAYCLWNNRNIRTPELLKKEYRTWYGKSQYARDYLEREKSKGRRNRHKESSLSVTPIDATTAGKLPIIFEGKISTAYHALHPSDIQDFSDVFALPLISNLMSRSKVSDKQHTFYGEPGKEELSENKIFKKSAVNMFVDREQTAPLRLHNTKNGAGIRANKRLTTPAIREMLENDTDCNKKQAVQDYIFG